MEYLSPANALFKQRVKGYETIDTGRRTVLQYTIKTALASTFVKLSDMVCVTASKITANQITASKITKAPQKVDLL